MEDPSSITTDTEQTLAVPATVTADRATLTVLTGISAGQVFTLDREAVVGRSTEAEVRLDEGTISRKHVKITRSPEGVYVVEDLSSTNGTFVAGRAINRCELASGDRIQLGPTLLLRFSLTDASEEAMQRKLFESSTRDALTGAFNRAHLLERLEAEIAHARRHGAPLSLLLFDLDFFKRVNDEHGHAAGDELLRAVAGEVGRHVRVEDVLARWGGEEFVLLARSTAHEDAMLLAERMRAGVESLRVAVWGLLGEAAASTTVSFGVAGFAELPPEAGPTEFFALADRRLYRAKAGGRNCVCGDG
jgi:diguanylate cyclase (GGDEF)-like protein